MLQSTFIHAGGIGPATERLLWAAGASTWAGFLDQHASGDWRGHRFERLARVVERSESALRRRDVTFFSRRLRPRHQWRLYDEFSDRVAYVDIETTGLHKAWDKVTVVALYDGDKTRTFVRGKNLERFPEWISRYSLLVTFNGSTFDVPFLRNEFPRIRIPPAHLDLRFALRRAGYSGGLKTIEQRVGIKRPARLRSINGREAVHLWYRYERGDKSALSTLVEYTAEDVKSLQSLAGIACSRLARNLHMPTVVS